jgi:hypothetical protein
MENHAAAPPDIQRIDDLDAADRTAEALAAPLTDAQFTWQPDGGTRWSVGQCLEHLAVANGLYGEAIRKAVDRAALAGWTRKGPLVPGFVGQKFVNSLEPPVKRRGRAPATIRPTSKLTRSDIMLRYREAHDRLRQAARDAAAIDANRTTFRNPFLKVVKVRVSTALHVVSAHDRRHLWQAEQVIRHPDFPR